MEIVNIKRRMKKRNANNIKIETKINNRQVTIIEGRCERKENQRKCHHKKKRHIRKRLIKIHRCVPIQSQCDHNCVVPIFIADTSYSFISQPSGTFTITNNSDFCTIKVIIKQKSHHEECVNVGAKSSFTGIFSNLKRIEFVCSSHVPHSVCIGTFDLDLLYIVKV